MAWLLPHLNTSSNPLQLTRYSHHSVIHSTTVSHGNGTNTFHSTQPSQGLLHPSIRHSARSWSFSRQHIANDQPHFLCHQIPLLSSTANSPNKTRPQWKTPADSCSSISLIQTWLLQHHYDQPTRHHTSSNNHYPPQCCTTRRKLEANGSYQPRFSATPLDFHQSTNFIPNLCPHVQHLFRIFSVLHFLLGHTVHKSRIEIESRSSAKNDYGTQRTSNSFGWRAFAIAVHLSGTIYLSPSIMRQLSDHSKPK